MKIQSLPLAIGDDIDFCYGIQVPSWFSLFLLGLSVQTPCLPSYFLHIYDGTIIRKWLLHPGCAMDLLDSLHGSRYTWFFTFLLPTSQLRNHYPSWSPLSSASEEAGMFLLLLCYYCTLNEIPISKPYSHKAFVTDTNVLARPLD